LKIAYIVTDPNIRLEAANGPAAHINGTIKGISSYGLNCRVFLASDYLSSKADRINPDKDVGLALNKIDPKNRSLARRLLSDLKRLTQNYGYSAKMFEDVAEFAPNIIYERSWLFSISCLRFCKAHIIPHFIETSGCAAEIAKDSYGLGSVSFANSVEAYKLRRADVVCVESRAAIEWVSAKFNLAGDVIAKPLAYESTASTSLSLGISDVSFSRFTDRHEFVVVFVGSFQSYQGVSLLLESANCLKESRPDIGILLIGAGGNFDESVEFCLNGGLTNCFFTGKINPSEVDVVFKHCDVGIVPDCERHMTPIKTLHYGACGLPVIVPDYKCMEGVVNPGVHGFRFDPRDIHSISESISVACSDKSSLSDMGSAMRINVEDNFNWREVLFDVIEKIGEYA